MAEVLRYAHGHGLAHRVLQPSAVLVHARAAGPEVFVRDWQAASAVELTSSTSTHHARDLVAHDESGAMAVYAAPEVALGMPGDRRAADVYSLGSLAYLVLTGSAPAQDADELRARLARDQGLLLGAAIDSPPTELEVLVSEATCPRVGARTPSIDAFLSGLDEALDELTTPDVDPVATDPLTAGPGDVLDGGMVVARVLGEGATSVALLVDRPGADRAVLKVARDDVRASRVRDEAESLARVPGSDLVAGLVEGPIEVGGRTCLLVEPAGTDSLATEISRTGRLNLERLRRWGRDLCEAVQLLDTHGVSHRDVKPANLGVRTRPGDGQPHLVLFDFSLASASAQDLDAGTAGYRDPFLGPPDRRYFDPAAELFAVSVTLHEMATGRLPVWGDGRSDPRVVDEEVGLDVSTFDPAVATAMVDLFRRALARDAGRRFANAHDLAQAWDAVFETAPVDDDERRDLASGRAVVETPLGEAGLTAQALSALERYEVATVGDLLDLPPLEPSRMRGASQATKDEVVARVREWRARLRPRGDLPTTSVDALVDRLLPPPSDDPHDRARRYLLGREDPATSAPSTTWPTASATVNELDLERQVVDDTVRRLAEDAHERGVLDVVAETVSDVLDRLGGVASLDEVVRRVVDARGSHAQEPRRGAQAAALVRLHELAGALAPIEVLTRVSGATRVVTTVDDGGRQAADERLQVSLDLARRAEEMTSATSLLPPETVTTRLREVTRGTVLDSLDDARIRALAAAASGTTAVSARGELYLRGLQPTAAVRLARESLLRGGRYSERTIQQRVRARFPEALDVPGRPDLDDILREADVDLLWDGDVFVRRGTTAALSRSSSTAHGAGRDETVGRIDGVLRSSLEQRGFLALGVSRRHAVAASRRLLAQHAVREVDITSWVVASLRADASEMGADWEFVLGADAPGAPGTDRRELDAIVAHAARGLRDHLDSQDGPLLLTGAGVLAHHHCLGLLAPVSDLAASRPAARWLLAPHAVSGARTVDGAALPVGAPGQWLHLPTPWVLDPAHAPDADEGHP